MHAATERIMREKCQQSLLIRSHLLGHGHSKLDEHIFYFDFFGVEETRNRMAKYGVSVRDIEKENCPLIYWWHMAIQLLASNNRVDEFFAT